MSSSVRSRGRRRDRTRTAVIAVSVLLVVLTGAGLGYTLVGRATDHDDVAALPTSTPSATWSASATPATPATPTTPTTPTAPGATSTPVSPPAAARSYAATGPNTFVYAGGQSAVFGTAGALSKYRVAIETGTPVPVDEFAGMVDATLSDPRSWIGGNNVRLQRVAGDAAGAAFTVFLVTPGTAEKLCLAGGFDIFWRGEPYTSCRVGSKVVINISRYMKAVPDYGAPLGSYRQYAINHEVGHALGHGHELCPGKGQPAPVMQQQTFDLQGCVAYFWPYLDGKRYAGPAGRIVPSG